MRMELADSCINRITRIHHSEDSILVAKISSKVHVSAILLHR